MTFDELKALDHAHTLQTYGRFDVDVDHGQGATLWDLAGRTYIDFTSGIGVCSVGYGNEKWARAIYDQALTLGHISNLFYSQPYARLAGALCARSGMAAAFFGNSGAEANEGLLKLARKYSHDKYGAGRGTILTLRNSFHGRTLATLAATGQDVFHQHFFPFPEGFRHTGANDLADVEAQAGEDVCAVLLELVQGEGGVLPMDRDFVRALAGLCEQRDWLLLVDEVQTGIGRTGTLFAFQQYGIRPDAVSFAKGIAGGLPMGGFLVNEKWGAGGGPRPPRLHLWGQPRLLRSRPGGAGHSGRGGPEPGQGEGGLSAGTHRGNGQAMPGCHPGPGPHDRGGGPPRLEQQGAGRPVGRTRPAGAHRRPRPAAVAPPDHHEGRDGPGPGHPGPGPGVTPGCARHFCMR